MNEIVLDIFNYTYVNSGIILAKKLNEIFDVLKELTLIIH